MLLLMFSKDSVVDNFVTLLLYNDHLVNLSRYTDHVVDDVQQGLGGGQQPSPPPPPKDGHPIQEQLDMFQHLNETP